MSGETFSIPRTGSVKSLCSEGEADFGANQHEASSPAVPVRKVGQLRVSASSPAMMQLLLPSKNEVATGQGNSERFAPTEAVLPHPELEATDHNLATASSADTQTPGSPNSDSRSSKGATSPVRVPRGGNGDAVEGEAANAPHAHNAAEQLLEGVAPADERRREWIANVQKKFGADPHYHVRNR